MYKQSRGYVLQDPRARSGMISVLHYTDSAEFDLMPIKAKNHPRAMNKPVGALWTTPEESEGSWSQWCVDNRFELRPYVVQMTLAVVNCFRIDFVEDLAELPWYDPYADKVELNYFRDVLDYEKIIEQGYDCIWLTDEGQWRTRMSHPQNLYGWDCETICVLTSAPILEWRELGPHGIETNVRSYRERVRDSD